MRSEPSQGAYDSSMLCPSRLVTRGSLLVLLASCDPDVTVNPTGGGSTGAISPAPIGGSPVGGAPITGGAATEGGANPVGGMGGGGDPQGGGGEAPLPCSEMVAAPAPFEQLFGFTSSEDFVFDSLGNYVSIDDNGNLVRITKAGVKTLWIPALGFGTAGMAVLPDDSVVFCDVSNGALKRAYPSGTVTTVIGGLNYPNGLDIGPDGYLYVAEDSGNKLRRVHPDTGVSTIVVNLPGPNGVAFTDDPTVVYVGSYSYGVIYKVEQPVPGQPGSYTTLVQSNAFAGGGIDGMGVDKCGNIYAAEFVSGNVYRILPTGQVTTIANLPSSWIPNIKWGRGLGGFDTNVMYVADRSVGSLFGVNVNVEGVDEFFDL